MRCGEGVVTYPGGRQDVGIWRGAKLVRLKFALREVTVDPLASRLLSKSHGLLTPDIKSRGNHGPKGILEVCSYSLCSYLLIETSHQEVTIHL